VGGFAERAALPVACVHPLPKGLDPVTAALAEPAACCLSGLEMFTMPRHATVVVMGGGIMGLLTMVLARRRGAGRLILSDPLAERREIARRLGARVVVDPTRESLHDQVMELTGGRGAEVVCEAVGKPELVGEAFALVKPTGVLQLVGVNPKGSRMPRDPNPRRLRPRHRLPPGAGAAAEAQGEAPDRRALPARAHRGGVRARRGRPGREDGRGTRRGIAAQMPRGSVSFYLVDLPAVLRA
jgi:threonine dehydrogenase-like Zn-dependent dehydrogenase